MYRTTVRTPKDNEADNDSKDTQAPWRLWEQQAHHVPFPVPGEWFCWGSLCGTWPFWLQCGSSSEPVHRMHSPAWKATHQTWYGHGNNCICRTMTQIPATVIKVHASHCLRKFWPHVHKLAWEGGTFEKKSQLKQRQVLLFFFGGGGGGACYVNMFFLSFCFSYFYLTYYSSTITK